MDSVTYQGMTAAERKAYHEFEIARHSEALNHLTVGANLAARYGIGDEAFVAAAEKCIAVEFSDYAKYSGYMGGKGLALLEDSKAEIDATIAAEAAAVEAVAVSEPLTK